MSLVQWDTRFSDAGRDEFLPVGEMLVAGPIQLVIGATGSKYMCRICGAIANSRLNTNISLPKRPKN
jgi:hypothetical protein